MEISAILPSQARGHIQYVEKSRGQSTYYSYDPFGNLTQTKDAKNNLTTLTYDLRGRKTAMVVSSIDTSYTVTTAYDAYGRPDSYTYPTGFATQNIYNAQGYLSKVVNKASPTTVYWQATSKDAEGHLLSQTLGNGLVTTQTFDPNSGRVQTITTGSVQNVSYTFDSIGNLQARSDSARGLVEGFIFDELNRLKTYTLNGTTPQTFNYDEIGNITYKSDMGFYTYGTKPHAVTGVTGGTSTLSYTYDNNGNMQAGANRSVTWNSFNMVSQITQGANTLMFNYDNDHARIKEVGPNGTTIYLNPRLDSGQHFEKVTTTSGVIEYKQYLYAGNLPIGVYTSRSNGQNDTKYFHTDHLGSIAVVTNESGAVLARYNYDPFGNRTVVAGTDVTDHGFTGHETMVEVGLVNMNGRVYDPALARFMSADPNIQAAANPQNFNRYSYVLNNPLSYTDPSGFSWWTKFRDNVLKPVVVIAVAVVAAPYAATYAGIMSGGSAIAMGAATGATIGATAGLVYNGPQGMVKGGVTGGISGGILGGIDGYYGDKWSWERVGANSATGGINSKLQGGRFEDGFKFSAITSTARFGYNEVVKYDVTWEKGGDAVNKGAFDMPVQGANNIGTANLVVDPNSLWGEGGVVSRFANNIPGVNAVSGMHDVFQVRLDEWGGNFARNALNVSGMLPAAGITYVALFDGIPGMALTVTRTQREQYMGGR